MQDKTINNALLALRKQGGQQADLALQLLELRNVPIPRHFQTAPAPRRLRKGFVLGCLSLSPMTAPEIADRLQDKFGFPRRSALNRVYCCLVRLEAEGLVVRDGKVWGMATAGNSPAIS